MYEIAKELFFSYGHRLMNHAGKCKMLHGHNAKISIKLGSENLSSEGMVLDFSELKYKTKHWIDETFDHQMLLYEHDPIVSVLQNAGEHIRILPVHPTAECLAKLIFEFVESQKFPVKEVLFWETESCMASFKR